MDRHRDDVVLNIDGYIPVDPAGGLRRKAMEFLASRRWTTDQVEYGDQPETEGAEPGVTLWSMSFNFGLDHLESGTPDWPSDVAALIEFARSIANESGDEFVVEVRRRSMGWYTEHITFLGEAPVDYEQMYRMIKRAARCPARDPATLPPKARRRWWKPW